MPKPRTVTFNQGQRIMQVDAILNGTHAGLTLFEKWVCVEYLRQVGIEVRIENPGDGERQRSNDHA